MHTTRVRVRLLGQLGNQLFCYYAGAYLALKSNSELTLDCNHFQGQDGHLSLLDFRLPYPYSLAGATPRRSSLFGVNRTQRLLGRTHDVRQRWQKALVVSPQHFGYFDFREIVGSIDKRHVDLNGFFQTFRYVDALKEIDGNNAYPIVRNESWWRDSQEALELIGAEDSLCVHVRLGDYLGSPFAMNYPDYLRKVWAASESLFDCRRVVLFSDDLPKAQHMLREVFPVPVLGAPLKPYMAAAQVMSVMAQARRLAVANSSFSWWAAYLSQAWTIFAPWPWIGGSQFRDAWRREDFIPQKWRVVSANYE